MLKQIAIIFSMSVFLCSLTLAQEKPEKENAESEENVEFETEQETQVLIETETVVIWNKVCPVKGNPIEEDTPTVEYNGKIYGFCCPGCDTKFAKNPEKYAKNLSEDGTKFIGRK